MRDETRFKLWHGPYRTPRFKYGAKVVDEWRGEVRHVHARRANDGSVDVPFVDHHDALNRVSRVRCESGNSGCQ